MVNWRTYDVCTRCTSSLIFKSVYKIRIYGSCTPRVRLDFEVNFRIYIVCTSVYGCCFLLVFYDFMSRRLQNSYIRFVYGPCAAGF
jgi:hypothetical protein